MPKINDEDIYKHDDYRSILNLFKYCSNINFKKTGLTHGQILYALSKKPKKDIEMEKFFDQFTFGLLHKRKFKDLYKSEPFIIKGKKTELKSELTRCIVSAKQLNDKLQFLINREWIKPEGKPKYYTYHLTRKYYTDMEKRNIKSMLNEWNDRETIEKLSLELLLPQNSEESFIKNSHFSSEKSDWTLFGLSFEFLFNLSDEEKKDMCKWLSDIEKNLWNIMELKFSKQKITRDEFLKQLSKGDTTFLDKGLSLHTINFFYHGYKHMVYTNKK